MTQNGVLEKVARLVREAVKVHEQSYIPGTFRSAKDWSTCVAEVTGENPETTLDPVFHLVYFLTICGYCEVEDWCELVLEPEKVKARIKQLEEERA